MARARPDERLPSDDPAVHLEQLYARGIRRLQLLITDALANDRIRSADYRQQQLTLAMAIVARLRRDTRPLIPGIAFRAYADGATSATALTHTEEVGFGGIHTQAVEQLAKALASSLDAAHTEVGRRTNDLYRRVALERIGEGTIAGDTRRAISQAIVNDLKLEGVTGFVDKAGRRWRLDSYARMVVRTTSREAVSHGTANRLIETGRPDVTVSDHDTTTPLCEVYEGNTYSLVKGRQYPLLRELPPFHPNCKHIIVPARVSVRAMIEQMEKATDYEAFERELFGSSEAAARALAAA